MSDPFEGEWSASSDKSLYTKIEPGETKLRIVSKALVGWEGWFQNKPVRFKADYKITPDEYATLDKDNYNPEKSKWRQFAVCVVYNYKEDAVQYWMFAQKQIKDQMIALASDEDWGSISDYDIKVKREGEKMETKYTLTPSNKAALTEEILTKIKEADLHPEQTFLDQRNLDNINALRAAAESAGELKPEDIPF